MAALSPIGTGQANIFDSLFRALAGFSGSPEMSSGHLLFAVGLTAQILISIPQEERDIEDAPREPCREYRRRTPGLIEFFRSKG